jgi:dTDP-4-dehydrorhamnose 3,5-epimerase
VVLEIDIPGVVVIEPEVYLDARGDFLEAYHADKYANGRLAWPVRSGQPLVLGAQHDSRTAPAGAKAAGQAGSREQFYIPEGCAHRFCVVSDRVQVEYRCTALYDPSGEAGIAYDDPTLGISWPVTQPLPSDRDRRHSSLAEFLEAHPHYDDAALGAGILR